MQESLTAEYKIPEEDWFSTNPSSLSHHSRIIRNILEKLNGVQLETFRSSCFGHLLSITEMVFSCQLIHALRLRQIKSDMKDGLKFFIGDSITSFCEHDFSLVTGLKCGEFPQRVEVEPSAIPLKEKYFRNLKSIPFTSLEDSFSECEVADDSLKLALVLFAEGVLNGREKYKPIEMQFLMLVENLPEFNNYPWGSFSWNHTFECLREDLVSGVRYSLKGFPPAFQVWAYEVIPDLMQYKLCCKINTTNSYPRIITWTTPRGKPTMDKLAKIFEKDPRLELFH
ncbi:uncharacterized protein LOC126798342 [Argentina anserina]|uniref:uncharacterized protein LOC126798342 n=1 Tax=Argentina anserina TaxID=57926 RepID=UPI002176224C|nr:uncharacterized protein LOC126798342 [Potentilla anserina]